ncbi:MAG: hypothetical protein CMN76_04310 [Spirochaetaceae bacterium]|nr:hypothetical protein [Spirochaetaceae bacterium]|tara:strand:- start:336411 stop:337190 length:780 start_codon:yes stop_codon:yes gene_type:complete
MSCIRRGAVLLSFLSISFAFFSGCTAGRVKVSDSECRGLTASADGYLDQGDREYDRRNIEGALESYKKALCREPESVSVHLSLSLTLGALGRTEEALAHTDYILTDLKPGSIEALTNKGLILQRAGRYGEARKIHEEILVRRPSSGPALLNLGLVEYQMGNEEEAIRRFEAFIQRYPREVMGLANLAAIYSGRGEFAKAEELFNRSLRVDPDDYATHQNLANHYVRREEFGLAYKHYSRACDLGLPRACEDARWARNQQ